MDAEPAPVRFPFPLPERFAAAIGDRGRFGLIGLSWGAGDELAVHDPDAEAVGVAIGGPLEVACQSADDAAAAHRPFRRPGYTVRPRGRRMDTQMAGNATGSPRGLDPILHPASALVW